MIGTGEQVGSRPTSNSERLIELLGLFDGEGRKRFDLNPQEQIHAIYGYEDTRPVISVEFRREGKSLISFRLTGNALDHVGVKGFWFKLGDRWFKYEDYVEIKRGEVLFTDLAILDHVIADYAVDLVSRSIREKRIPEVNLPLKLAQGGPS